MSQRDDTAPSDPGRLLSCEAAADVLNVSLSCLSELVESGQIPRRQVGEHWAICAADLLDFRASDDQARREVRAALAREAERLGLGY
ncbi:MAG TPA: DNA-binding protein [Planctomycetes bacterium]|nr:DNA-binding protein [Planctomycetota bacterium]